MEEKQPFALLLNDIHADKDNLIAFEKNWEEALKICMDRNIGNIYIGGDLFKSRASQTLDTLITIRKCFQYAEEQDILVSIVPGNHDLVDQNAEESYCDIYEKKNAVIVSPLLICNLHKDFDLYVMRYWPEGGVAAQKVKELIANMDKKKKNILYCHFGISGFLSNPSSDELPISLFEPFWKVLAGHYHDRKKIKNVEYIGASRQHNFGEDVDKGYTILYTDGTTEFVKNESNIRYVTIQCNSDQLDSAVEQLKRYPSDKYNVKLSIKTNADSKDAINRNYLLEKGFSKIEVVINELQLCDTTESSLEAKYDKASIKEEYLKFCENENADPELGIMYIEKIK